MTFDQEEFDAIAEMESATRARSEAYTSVIKKYSRVFNEFSSSDNPTDEEISRLDAAEHHFNNANEIMMRIKNKIRHGRYLTT